MVGFSGHKAIRKMSVGIALEINIKKTAVFVGPAM